MAVSNHLNNNSLHTLLKVIQVYFGIKSKEEWTKYVGSVGIDWWEVYHLAEINQVRPIMYQVLQNTPDIFIVSIMEKLREISLDTCVKSLLQTAQITNIQAAFTNQGVDIIVHKGILYGQLFYKSTPDREVGDIDIIVKKTDIEIADKILSNMGYVSILHRSKHKIGHYEHGLDYHISYHNQSNSSYFPIELHWSHSSVRSIIDINTDQMVARNNKWLKNSSILNEPSLEDILLLLLTHHSSKEGWFQLKQLCDLQGFLYFHNKSINWNIVLDRLEDSNLLPHFFVGIGLVNYFLESNHFDENTKYGTVPNPKYRTFESMVNLQYQQNKWAGKVNKNRFYYLLWNLKVHRNSKLRLQLIKNHSIRVFSYLIE